MGAGPAGLTAAINLAKEGFKVDVYEKNSDVGGRFYGDIQGIENWSKKQDAVDDLNKMNIEFNFHTHPSSKITATDGLKINEIESSRKPLYYMVKRGNISESLDMGLKEQAQDAGATIHFEKTISRADIIATGPILENLVGVVKGITFKTDHEDSATVLFNHEAAFKGYAYFLVTDGHGCISTVLMEELNRVNSCFERAREIFINLYDFKIENPKKCGGVGCFNLNHIFKNDNNLFVGEAAGLQDMFLGFGMRYAIESGFLAARSIIDGEDYEVLAKSHFENRLKAGLVNRYLWEKLGRKNYSHVVANFGWLVRNFNWIYNYNIFQRILYPFALKGLKNRYGWL